MEQFTPVSTVLPVDSDPVGIGSVKKLITHGWKIPHGNGISDDDHIRKVFPKDGWLVEDLICGRESNQNEAKQDANEPKQNKHTPIMGKVTRNV